MSDLLETLMKTPRRRPTPPAQVRPFLELLLLRTPDDWDAKQTFEEELRLAEEEFRAAHPRGLTRQELDVDLSAPDDITRVVAEKLSANPKVADYFERVHYVADQMGKQWLEPLDIRVFAEWISQHRHDLNLHELTRFCTFGEIARLAHESFFSGPLTKDLEAHPFYFFVHKIKLAAWHWGGSELDWKTMVKFHRLFMSFSMDLPDFEVTFDHSHSWMNTRGSAEYTGKFQRCEDDPKTKPWLDGEFGLMVSFKGEHVLTVGVSPSGQGLLVNQIQLLKKKGNRWLYKLPKPYFEYVLDKLLAACEGQGIDMHLVTGESLSTVIQSLYKDKPFDKNAGKHVRELYDQPFASLMRESAESTVNGHKYHRVSRSG